MALFGVMPFVDVLIITKENIMYTLQELISENTVYHREYGINETDMVKVNETIKCIEETRNSTKPCAGDIIVCKGPKKTYPNGHLEFWNTTQHSSICVQPYTPFVNIAKSIGEGDPLPFFTTSGGYWFSVTDTDVDMFELVGIRMKSFVTWGHNGPCGGGAVRFRVTVNVWKIYLENIY